MGFKTILKSGTSAAETRVTARGGSETVVDLGWIEEIDQETEARLLPVERLALSILRTYRRGGKDNEP